MCVIKKKNHLPAPTDDHKQGNELAMACAIPVIFTFVEVEPQGNERVIWIMY